MKNSDYDIVHSLPGRVRVRLRAIYREPELAWALERELSNLPGVQMVRANPTCASVTIAFIGDVFNPGQWLKQLQIEDLCLVAPEHGSIRRAGGILETLHHGTYLFEECVPPPAQFFIGVISLAVSFIEFPTFLKRMIVSTALLPILNRAIQTLLHDKRLSGNALDSACCILLISEGNFLPAAVMIFLIGLGEFIRDIVTGRCQKLIAHQFALSQRSAWLIRGKSRMRVPVLELRHGDRLVVYPGELIAVEGIIIDGQGTVVPADPELDFEPQMVRTGDRVTADTVLADGKLYVQNERADYCQLAEPTAKKHKERQIQRTHLHKSAMRAGHKTVWPLLGLAAFVFAVTRDLHRSLAIICFDFITGIRIAIPTAVLASMYKAGNRGIVIRNAGSLEKLAEVNAVVFARGGVLTVLEPAVTEVFVCDGFTFTDVSRFAAAVEQRYAHLAAHAIYKHANLHTIPVPERTTSDVISGLGVTGVVEGHNVLVGSTRLLQQRQIDLAAAALFLDKCQRNGDSRVCVAIDNKLAGVIAYQDPIREDARQVIAALRELGIAEIAMTSGGSQASAESLAQQAGISNVHYRMSAEDKALQVKEYKQRGLKVAVVGSDVEDTLALEQADLAVALSTGSDVARYRADVVLTADSLEDLVEGIQIARAGMDLARQNLRIVSIPNWIGLALCAMGSSNLLVATLLNNGSVIVGAGNGLRPMLDDGATEDGAAEDNLLNMLTVDLER